MELKLPDSRKVENYGFVLTGERRAPREGEWVLDVDGCPVQDRCGVLADHYWIVQPVRPPKPTADLLALWGMELTGECRVPNKNEAYSTTGRGITRENDVVNSFVCWHIADPDGLEYFTAANIGQRVQPCGLTYGGQRWLLRPDVLRGEPPKPAPQPAKTPVIPKPSADSLAKWGMELTGEFRYPLKGEPFCYDTAEQFGVGEGPSLWPYGERWILRKVEVPESKAADKEILTTKPEPKWYRRARTYAGDVRGLVALDLGTAGVWMYPGGTTDPLPPDYMESFRDCLRTDMTPCTALEAWRLLGSN